MANNFWANQGAAAKRKYRFKLRVNIPGTGNGAKFEEWVITKVNRPSFAISGVEHSYLNHTFKFPGRLTWEDVSFSIVEPYNGDQVDVLMQAIANSGYEFPSASSHKTIAKQNAIFKTFEIESIDENGKTADTWFLENAWISNANLGEYDYGSDDLMGVDVTVKYDYARYKSVAPSVSGAQQPVNPLASTGQ